MVDKDRTLPKTLFLFTWHFLREYKSAVNVYAACAIVSGFWRPFNSMFIKQVINLLPNVIGGDISILIVLAILIGVNFIVFDQGIIEEDGIHAELFASNGLYRTLWDAQVGG